MANRGIERLLMKVASSDLSPISHHWLPSTLFSCLQSSIYNCYYARDIESYCVLLEDFFYLLIYCLPAGSFVFNLNVITDRPFPSFPLSFSIAFVSKPWARAVSRIWRQVIPVLLCMSLAYLSGNLCRC